MPPLCTTVGIQKSENVFVVTSIDINKVNPPDSRTYDVGDMNGRHSSVSSTENFLHCFDQEKDSHQNIDRNKHTEELGGTGDDDDDDDVLFSSSE